ncbi:unnamed protein product, partial [Prorocentrum cordatum]
PLAARVAARGRRAVAEPGAVRRLRRGARGRRGLVPRGGLRARVRATADGADARVAGLPAAGGDHPYRPVLFPVALAAALEGRTLPQGVVGVHLALAALQACGYAAAAVSGVDLSLGGQLPDEVWLSPWHRVDGRSYGGAALGVPFDLVSTIASEHDALLPRGLAVRARRYPNKTKAGSAYLIRCAQLFLLHAMFLASCFYST